MGTEAAGALGAEYGRYRTEMNARALLYGTTTTKEFTGFRKPVLEETEEVPEGDFVADDRADLYFVSVDVDGEIGWESGIFCNKGRAPAHVIEVLTASTPTAYKACLRKTGVSYIIAGEKELDCEAAMKKCINFSHRKTADLRGRYRKLEFPTGRHGGMNSSLFLEPVTDGGCGTASLFTQIQPFTEGEPIEFLLREIEQIGGGGGLRLNYQPQNRKI